MFDIEEKIELIPDPKTKDLFKEVYSSYQQGNYRSSVVMLWSVVIADIIFKLKFLDDTYRNKKAEVVLKEIKKKQEEHPENSEWEKELLKKSCDELKFITPYEKTNLEFLQKQRHASAHPVLTDDSLLLAPNKDTVRSLIRNAMEAILLKTPLLHSELVDFVTEDLAKNKDRLVGYDNIKPYIQKRFFPNISNDGAKKILKALWRFVFNPNTKQELDNQEINYYALTIFFERFKKIYKEEIRENPSRYQVSSSHLERIVSFLKSNPDLFNILDESLKTLIRSSISDLNKYFECDFLSSNLEEHYNKVILRLSNETLSLTPKDIISNFKKAKEKSLESLYLKICISYYSKSFNFDTADSRYYIYIDPLLSEYKLQDIIYLMKETDNCSQVCNRRQAFGDHKNVLKRFHDLGGTDDQIQDLTNWNDWNNLYLNEIKARNEEMAKS